MNNTFWSILLLGLLCSVAGLSQERKSIPATRTQEPITIDGIIDESVWESAPIATDFVQNRPDAGNPSQRRTEVKVLYDDDAVYVAAKLYDDPSRIFNFLSNRDEIGNSDFFGVVIDPYKAGQNGIGLVVTPAGVQFDVFYSSSGEDSNWNAVWQSETRIVEDGWVAEYRIPYAALRFATKPIQDWGINFTRNSRDINESAWWNEVNPNISGFLNQAGVLEGIKNVQAPQRLFLYPYASTVITNDGASGQSDVQMNGGMDLKYGINDAFTLDMTLIPDFSGVRSDNQVLNLGPFEVRFDENRQFFTEGTELFNKGGLFYSRRIGSSFGNITGEIGENEELLFRPNDAPLINATKISGRTNDGLGIGFFNAMTNTSYATVRNIESGERREVEADPFTNFNVLVFDQNLKNNSSFTFINTNVLRSKGVNDANVSAATFSINDKNIRWNISGFAALSQILSTDPTTGKLSSDAGYAYTLRMAKVSGKYQYGFSRNVESDNYNPNDLGFLQSPNEVSHRLFASFNEVNPFGIFNRLRIGTNLNHQSLFEPNEYARWGYNLNINGQFRNFWNFGINHGVRPSKNNDFFESRTAGLIMERPANMDVNMWVGSDSRKNLRGSVFAGLWRSFSWNGFDNWLGGNVTYQASDRLLFQHNLNITHQRKSRGFATKLNDGTVIMGQRDIDDVVNTLNASYIFTNRMGLTFRMRHYWRTVFYYNFYELNENRQLVATDYTGRDDNGMKLHDTNFNVFNIDMVYNWQFAPGSELRIVWKRSSLFSNRNTDIDFFRNFDRTVSEPSFDSFTIRLLYFLDFQNVKKVFQR